MVQFDDFTIGSGEKGIGILQSVKKGSNYKRMILKEAFFEPLLGLLAVCFPYILLGSVDGSSL